MNIYVQILKDAKKDFVKRPPARWHGICQSIWIAAGMRDQMRFGKRITNKISKALEPHYFVGSWLHDQGHYLTDEQLYQYRLRWLNQLIKDWE